MDLLKHHFPYNFETIEPRDVEHNFVTVWSRSFVFDSDLRRDSHCLSFGYGQSMCCRVEIVSKISSPESEPDLCLVGPGVGYSEAFA